MTGEIPRRGTGVPILKRMVTVLVIAAFMAIAVPAAASAASLWVSQSGTVTPNGKSCAQPGYTKIQEAVIAAGSGATVNVCAGTYSEQLVITTSVSLKADGMVTVQLPAAPANSTGACGTALAANTQVVVEACGNATVKDTGVNIKGGWASGTCNDNLYDVLAGNGVKLTLTDVSLLEGGAVPLNGCQGGLGLELNGSGSAKLKHVTVSGYQKGGVEINGAGATANINDITVTGAGSTPEIAQNGIQISRGATAKINKAKVTKNQYAPEALSSGILFFEGGGGSSVKNSNLTEDDYGVVGEIESSLSVTKSAFESDSYGVFAYEDAATVNDDTFNKGLVGIALEEASGTGSGDTIKNMSEYAVAGYFNGGAGGSFTITKSKMSGNPGPTPEESVHSEPPEIVHVTPSDS